MDESETKIRVSRQNSPCGPFGIRRLFFEAVFVFFVNLHVFFEHRAVRGLNSIASECVAGAPERPLYRASRIVANSFILAKRRAQKASPP